MNIGINAFTLKMIAIVAMLIDHIGAVLFPQIEILRIIGRIAFPIFAETIAWKGFSFAEIKQAKSDYEVSGKTQNQVIGEYYSESK